MPKREFAALLSLASAFALGPAAAAQPGGASLSGLSGPSELPGMPWLLAAETNPPGDIPDSQAFVAFRSPLGFTLKVPEGWARRELADGVRFNDKYNAVQVNVTPRAAAPTLQNLTANEVAALGHGTPTVRVESVKPLTLPAGSAFVVHYASRSDPNPVTNKAIRQDNARYYFWKAGRLATLTLSAPAGADNADQWQLMARSFAWQ